MKIQYTLSGLGNQIRQYAFVRFAERSHPGDKWVFDDSWFFMYNTGEEQRIEIERVFEVKLNRLSSCFDSETWTAIIQKRKSGMNMPQILMDMGIPIVAVDGKPYTLGEFSGKTIKTTGFQPEIIDLPYENIYYLAFYGKNTWFTTYRDENLAELVFPPLTSQKNQEYAEMIKSTMSVGIHVRRGDFKDCGLDLPVKYYKAGCKRVLDVYPDASFFIFSDELEWCMANAKELGFCLPKQTTYVDGNTGENNYVDMQLLSMCRGLVRNAESSFSQVAGWLNRNLEFDIKLTPEEGFVYKHPLGFDMKLAPTGEFASKHPPEYLP